MIDQAKVRRLKLALEAAYVDRCHTRRVIGEYNVGVHSFNMLTMLRLLWPTLKLGAIPTSLVWAIHDHDIPERLVGDTPRNAKPHVWRSDNADKVEQQIIEELFARYHYDDLTADEVRWLHGLDVLEFYAFCLDQRHLGNRNFDKDMSRCEEFFHNNAHLVPKEVTDMFFQMGANWETVDELRETK